MIADYYDDMKYLKLLFDFFAFLILLNVFEADAV